jgi:hypothetical protein
MADETYIVKLKPPQMSVQVVAASTAEIHGDHLALLNANGELVALLLLDIVESWSVVRPAKPRRVGCCRITAAVKSSEKVM